MKAPSDKLRRYAPPKTRHVAPLAYPFRFPIDIMLLCHCRDCREVLTAERGHVVRQRNWIQVCRTRFPFHRTDFSSPFYPSSPKRSPAIILPFVLQPSIECTTTVLPRPPYVSLRRITQQHRKCSHKREDEASMSRRV